MTVEEGAGVEGRVGEGGNGGISSHKRDIGEWWEGRGGLRNC